MKISCMLCSAGDTLKPGDRVLAERGAVLRGTALRCGDARCCCAIKMGGALVTASRGRQRGREHHAGAITVRSHLNRSHFIISVSNWLNAIFVVCVLRVCARRECSYWRRAPAWRWRTSPRWRGAGSTATATASAAARPGRREAPSVAASTSAAARRIPTLGCAAWTSWRK